MTYSYIPLLKTQYAKNTKAFPFQFYKTCCLCPLWAGVATVDILAPTCSPRTDCIRIRALDKPTPELCLI